MMSDRQIARLVQLRGLGFSEREIGLELGVSQSTVSYNLKRIKTQCLHGDPDRIFQRILLQGHTHAIDKLLKALRQMH